uniref:Uncharacterized protein n=1 Tax=Timema monikensis TaxID=170555 RepID=A0A7R9EE49_9NEOP|nr:unnamed protein product [Timema monikensis]
MQPPKPSAQLDTVTASAGDRALTSPDLSRTRTTLPRCRSISGDSRAGMAQPCFRLLNGALHEEPLKFLLPEELGNLWTISEFRLHTLVLNTYTNAEKLLTAAEELAQTGECNADEIYSVAHELESHVTSFAARVEQRRRRLDLTVLFYNREKELFISTYIKTKLLPYFEVKLVPKRSFGDDDFDCLAKEVWEHIERYIGGQ